MSSQSRITIRGQAPFKQSGVYEAQIIISDSKPSEDAIKTKQFVSLWRGNFHLRVNNGIFSETIGSVDNPLPSSIGQLDSIWIIVVDLFSSLHSVFNVPLANSSRPKKDETIPDAPRNQNLQLKKFLIRLNLPLLFKPPQISHLFLMKKEFQDRPVIRDNKALQDHPVIRDNKALQDHPVIKDNKDHPVIKDNKVHPVLLDLWG